MSATDRFDLPSGFGGTVQDWHELVPAGAVLCLPRDARQDGPALRIPDGSFDAIFVAGLAEGLGALEPLCRELAARLRPGGVLLFDALNQSSPRQLRLVLEGRPNGLDPIGSLRTPEIPTSVERLVDAVTAAGLAVDDVLRLPHPDAFGAPLVRALIDQGLMAACYAGGVPPARLWLRATKRARCAGTALIGTGAADAQLRTREALARFLPRDWEVVCCRGENDGTGEHVAWNRGVAGSRGEHLWFLRAGAAPSAELFEAQWQHAALAPCVPGDGAPARPGDADGLLIARRDLLRIGPFDETWSLPSVAYEDWGMRAESSGVRVEAAGSALASPPAAVGSADELEREAARLVARWEGVGAPRDGLRPGPRATQQGALEPWHGRAPRITLCMIARNEERFLPECLRRAAPAVDEIVVVDTGSTDRTIEIARSFGAKVVEEAWTDHFAFHRNTSLRHATGDWVLVLDADEFLDDDQVDALRRAVLDPNVSGYHIRFTNIYGDQKTLGVTMVRLFRNLPGIQWVNRIHEQITPSLLLHSAGLVLSNADVHVLHHGYADAVMDERGKIARNERLFEMQLAEHPDDIYSLYKYGDFLRRVPGRDGDARAMLERTFDLIVAHHPGCPRGIPYAGEVAALCALELAREDRWERAEEVVELALTRFMATPNLHYIAASIALRRGREDEAITHYRQCLRYRGQTLVVPIQDGITGHVSLTGIAQALLQKGDRAGARRTLEQALALDDSHDVTAMVLSRLWLEDGDAPRALQVLTDYLSEHPDSAGACQQTTLLLARLGYTDQARRMGQRAIELLEARASSIEANEVRKALAALG